MCAGKRRRTCWVFATTKKPPSTAAHSDASSIEIAKYLVTIRQLFGSPIETVRARPKSFSEHFATQFSFAHHSASCATCVRGTPECNCTADACDATRATDDLRDSVSPLTLNVDASTAPWKRIPCSEITFRFERIFRLTQSRHFHRTRHYSLSNRKQSFSSRSKSGTKSI